MIDIVYSEDLDYIKANNCESWEEYFQKHRFPTKNKLTQDRLWANSIINKWTGSKNVDISDPAYTTWLKQLEVEVIMRMHDKGVDRKSGEAKGIYSPHDYLYKAERSYCIQIGVNTGHRKRRGARA